MIIPENKKYFFRMANFFYKSLDNRNFENREIIFYKEKKKYKKILDLIDFVKFKDHGHSFSHAFRVGIFSMIFYSQLFPENDDFIQYFLMGFLHDIGRVDGSKNNDHGYNSVKIIKKYKIKLKKEFLDAICNHPFKEKAETVQEMCLFDADRLDLLRFNRSLDEKFFSDCIKKNLNSFIDLNKLFIKNKFCSFIPCQVLNKKAIKFLMYLYNNCEYFNSQYLYHGSDISGLSFLSAKRRHIKFPLDGSYLYTTKDFYEAFLIAYSRTQGCNVSLYSVRNKNVKHTIFTIRGIEYVFDKDKKICREIYIDMNSEKKSAFEYYKYFCFNDLLKQFEN